MAELLADPEKYRGKRLAVYTDNVSTVAMYNGQKGQEIVHGIFSRSSQFYPGSSPVPVVHEMAEKKVNFPG